MLVCAKVHTFGTRDRGCSAHPAFPAPSLQERRKRICKTSGETRRENADACLYRVPCAAPQERWLMIALQTPDPQESRPIWVRLKAGHESGAYEVSSVTPANRPIRLRTIFQPSDASSHQVVGEIALRQLAAHLDEGVGWTPGGGGGGDGDDKILARFALALPDGRCGRVRASPARSCCACLFRPPQAGGGIEHLTQLSALPS